MTDPILFNRYEDDGRMREVIWPEMEQVIWVWHLHEWAWVLAFVREVGGQPALFAWSPIRSMNQDLFHGWISHWMPLDMPTVEPPAPPRFVRTAVR